MAKEAKKKKESEFDPDAYLAKKESVFDPDKYLAEKEAKEIPAAEAAIQGLGQGATFGYLPELQAAASKPIYAALNLATGQDIEPESYEQEKLRMQELQAKAAQESPKAYMGGQLASMFIPIPGNALAKAGGKVGSVVKGSGALSKIGRGALTGATEGALYGALSNVEPGKQGDVNDQINARLGQALEGLQFGGAVGGGLPAAVEGLKTTGVLAKKGGQKLMTTIFGVSEENIERARANPNLLTEKAPTMEGVKDILDQTVGKLRDDVERYKQKHQGSSLEAKETKAALKEATKLRKEAIKDARLPKETQNQLADAIEDLKSNVIKESKESYEVLEKSNALIDIGPVKQELASQREALKIEGELLGTSAQSADKKLSEIQNLVSKLPDKTDPKVIKKIIQRLDKETSYGFVSGEFGDEANNAMKSVRRAFDVGLKEIPEYRAKMESIAPKADLLSQASQKFGKPEQRISKLERIDAPTMEIERNLLGQLGKETGRDFLTPIQDMMSLKAQGKGVQAEKQLMRSLPEFQDYERAIVKQRTSSNLLAQAKKELEPFKGITPEKSERFLNSVLGPNSVEQRAKLEQISQLADQDLLKMAQDANTAASFDKGYMQGSRNVNLWAMLMKGAIGGAAGGVTGGWEGLTGGALIGATVDRYGPAMAKQILKGMARIEGMPTIQKIRVAMPDIPPERQEELISQLRDYIIRAKAVENVSVSPEMIEQTKLDINNSKMNSIEKARNLNSLNRNGVLMNPSKIMDDGQTMDVNALAKKQKQGGY